MLDYKLPKRLPQFDSLRGLAILTVLLFHLQMAIDALPLRWIFRYGWVGVDLFFVISGFLITGILLETAGTWNWARNS
jgi:peptidoglycan/LPS O-acetylase OafA/YrhL